MVSLFERLEKGRPPQIEEPVKQSRRHADQKALIKDVLANGPAPATLVEERGAAHGFTKKQLSYARRQMRVVSFKEVGKINGRWFWALHNTSGIPAQRATPSTLGAQVTSLTVYRPDSGRPCPLLGDERKGSTSLPREPLPSRKPQT